MLLHVRWKRRIEMAFIWLYYATRNVWVIFLAWLYTSRSATPVAQSEENSPSCLAIA